METPPLPICPSCQAQIHQDQIKATAPCGTLFHTGCFLYLRPQRNGHLDNCNPCFELFYPEDAEVENEVEEEVVEGGNEANPRTRIRNLFDTNEKFRTLARDLVKQKTVVTKAMRAVTLLSKQKKQQIRNQLLTIRAQLQGLLEGKQGELRESEQYKEYVKAKRRYKGLLVQLRNRYDCSQYALTTYLNDKKGFRRFQGMGYRTYSSRKFMLRPWRYYVPV